MLKTKKEIEKIEKACQLGDLAFEYILPKIKVGVSEKEIARLLRSFFKENNAKSSFRIIVAFGKNSSEVHHKTNDSILKKGDIIMFDFGAKLDGFCSDMTRTIFSGKPSKKQIKMYGTVLIAQQKAIDYINKQIKSGKKIKASAVDKVARDYIISQGYPSIPHTLGHGIGKRVHQAPRLSPKSKTTLKEGMVFSIEPGIYLENFGGVRIEDLFVYEKAGLRKLTLSSVKPKII